MERRILLRVPFVSDNLGRKIKNIFRQMKVNVTIAHPCRTLGNTLRPKKEPTRCTFKHCKISRDICTKTNVVYKVQCALCDSFYIGCTSRPLHIRIHEHLIQTSSSILNHIRTHHALPTSDPPFVVSILAQARDNTDLHLKEAYFINNLRPNINKRDELEPLGFCNRETLEAWRRV